MERKFANMNDSCLKNLYISVYMRKTAIMCAIHSTKIFGLRFEIFLVSNGSRQVRKGLVPFHSQNDFRANVDKCCSYQSKLTISTVI